MKLESKITEIKKKQRRTTAVFNCQKKSISELEDRTIAALLSEEQKENEWKILSSPCRAVKAL